MKKFSFGIPMETERLSIWLRFIGLLLSVLVFGCFSVVINNKIQEKQLELQEMKVLGSFVEPATASNPATRLLVAQYFKTMTLSETFRKRWEKYYNLAKLEVVGLEKKKEFLEEEKMRAMLDSNVEQVAKITEKINYLETQLDVKPVRMPLPATSDTIYFVTSEGNNLVTADGQKLIFETGGSFNPKDTKK